MPATPSIPKAIAAIREVLASDPKKKKPANNDLYRAVHELTRHAEEIAKDPASLEAVLEVTAEIEAFRGRGNQIAGREMERLLGYIAMLATETTSPPSAETTAVLGQLAARAFARVQGPPVRSRHAGRLRAEAWFQLTEISEVFRDPAHLASALKVAADKRASENERQAAIEFLAGYWGSDDPDEATVSLLRKLEKDPPARDFLVTVLQAQIELGLNDEMGALFAVEDWDDEKEE